ncbi:MAG: protein translocase subunit SecF [Planctomycetales bacterium]|nr:protein translocase subunit SecF [bacterium]UNM07897.1 MAG: protein translocase subunit SecF [Planctomycetales bacterium]
MKDTTTQNEKLFRYMDRAPVWVAISILLILVGFGGMFVNHSKTGKWFNLSIHYTGGEHLLLKTTEAMDIDGQAVKAIVQEYSEGEPIVQVYANDPTQVAIKMVVKAEGATEADLSNARVENLRRMKEQIGDAYGGYDSATNPETLEQDHVSGTIGAELIRNTIYALIFGSFLIMLYILLRFGRWQYSVAAIIALLHDVAITLGFAALLRLEVADSFIAVVLTIIGYSINDTIIIFDRIRENARHSGDKYPLKYLCDLSLNQTLMRSINTSLTTIVMIIALIILGGENIRPFLVAMAIGLISGAYSSIFIAAPIMMWLSKGQNTGADLESDKIMDAPVVDVMEVPDDDDGAGSSTVGRQIDQALERKTSKRRTQKRRK